MDKWYYSKDGMKQEGPVSKKEAKGLYQQNPEILFWHRGLPRWKKGKEVFKLNAGIKIFIFFCLVGALGIGGFYIFQNLKPKELPLEIALFQRSFEAISGIPLEQRIAMDVFADKSRGLILFSNLPDGTKIDVKISKSQESFTLELFDHYSWKRDVNFPKGRFEVELLSSELPDFRAIPGVSIVKGIPRFASTYRYLLFEDPSWNVYLQHVGTLREVVSDFRKGYTKISSEKKAKEKIKLWKTWAPEWSKFFNQWGASAMKASQTADDRNLYKPLLSVYELQTQAWDEMRKVLLKDPKEHKILLSIMKKTEAKAKTLKASQ